MCLNTSFSLFRTKSLIESIGYCNIISVLMAMLSEPFILLLGKRMMNTRYTKASAFIFQR